MNSPNQTSSEDNIKDLANRKQLQASDPNRSVWVNASAGTGKTKVLIQRVLRLLLPRHDGHPGTRPDRILCLTYTNAAATEMQQRLLKTVQEWAICDENALFKSIKELQGQNPTEKQIKSARSLFTVLTDGPYYVRLLTIHSFCQSILARFPLEAGISPGFQLVGEKETTDLIHQAFRKTVSYMIRDDDLSHHYNHITSISADETIYALMNDFLSKRSDFMPSIKGIKEEAWKKYFLEYFKLPDHFSHDVLRQQICFPPETSIQTLLSFANRIGHLKNALALQDAIYRYTSSLPDHRIDIWDSLRDHFYTKEGKRRSFNPNKNPDIQESYEQCLLFIDDISEKEKILNLIDTNISLLLFVKKFMENLSDLKARYNFLDYDDLISKTYDLLSPFANGSAAENWISYKLDGGIDHILVDEAQDTSSSQWGIINSLSHHYFSEISADQNPKTLFIVGDQKQSIYRFQGADTENFLLSQKSLSARGENTGSNQIEMNISFRTAAPVLDFVDMIFADPNHQKSLNLSGPTKHFACRLSAHGSVSLLSSIPMVEKEKSDYWSLDQENGQEQTELLSEQIADYIKNILDQRIILSSTGKSAEPKDIMILLLKRSGMMTRLIAELRKRNIPVGGMDRINIHDDLAVQDCIAAARIALLPDDDYSFSCFLKSPFIDLSDLDLYEIVKEKGNQSIYESVSKRTDHHEIYSYINSLTEMKDNDPYTFFSSLLQKRTPGPDFLPGYQSLQKRMGMYIKDSVDELLTEALEASKSGISLERFIFELSSQDTDKKREFHADDNIVRLMTVHGSKGLESPIVILADCIHSNRDPHDTSIFWPSDTGCHLPIWAPSKKKRTDELDFIRSLSKDADNHEYMRLLYVALTRAKDHLVMTGKERKMADPDSWYYIAKRTFDQLRSKPGFKEITDRGQSILCYLNQENSDNQHKDQAVQKTAVLPDPDIPPYLMEQLLPDQSPHRPLRPVRASTHLSASSPLLSLHDPLRFRRGNIIHKLLQFVPNIDAADQGHAIHRYLGLQSDLSDEDRATIHNELMAILSKPDLAPLFGPGSKAEVPVTGQLSDGSYISGQVDRLWIGKDRIWIVDYKTNRPPPRAWANVPKGYQDQLRAYRDLIHRIYPDHQIHCALLWTYGPQFMVAPTDF